MMTEKAARIAELEREIAHREKAIADIELDGFSPAVGTGMTLANLKGELARLRNESPALTQGEGSEPVGSRKMGERSNDIMCRACLGTGEWEAACCNGAGGCSCRGELVPMGTCRVCGGAGHYEQGTANEMANVETIRGFGFIGTGPRGGYFGCAAMNFIPPPKATQ